MILDWAIIGGFISGALAGAGAQYGRLCTMAAIERALVGGDLRSAKAWGLALAVAICTTQAGVYLGVIDVAASAYLNRDLHLLGIILGGLLFGLGMTLAGTCSFGLVVRAGAGDMRAAITAIVVGIAAYAATSGVLAPVRQALLPIGSVQANPSLVALLTDHLGTAGRILLPFAGALLIVAIVLDRRLRNRPRLLFGSTCLGLAITLGWFMTQRAVDALSLDRPESLSFVAPVGRALLQIMIEPFRNVGFGVTALAGVAIASFAVAAVRGDIRWEAFDDATEMRRHLVGAALMGTGGVLGQGCTIGQGLSAGSALALSAPIFIAAVVVGARLGLWHLIEGRSIFGFRRAS